MKLFEEEKLHIQKQLEMIEKASFWLEQLQASCYVDSRLGRGFGSSYPEEAIKKLKTMKYALTLELISDEDKTRTD